ncbi:hypothetical protein EVAR_65793_1 [Eumeta japonica]|uniref:Uncharacterized protein n=1 Tax=Eumeta variegata TaxID=151549 RepID=A0A4C2A0Z7_EUMVA|nr:hypothetical protein EVAR_65793_1 [Eumeta japonica]
MWYRESEAKLKTRPESEMSAGLCPCMSPLRQQTSYVQENIVYIPIEEKKKGRNKGRKRKNKDTPAELARAPRPRGAGNESKEARADDALPSQQPALGG